MEDLGSRVAKIVAPLRRPTVLLSSAKVGSAPYVAPASHRAASSYLGGNPPAFAGFRWPEKDGRPLAFLACIDLGRFSAITWLPKSRLLLFFSDHAKQPWGFDPKHRGGWAVLYVPDTSPVVGAAPFPNGLGPEGRLPRRDVTFRVASVPPPWDLSPLPRTDCSDDEEERAINALEALRKVEYGDGPRHQIGGYPDPIQGAEMDQQCELASNGIDFCDPRGDTEARVKAHRAGGSTWRLLFQMDSDADLKVMWGDCGMIYFWVREQDARNRDFSGAWLVLQCH